MFWKLHGWIDNVWEKYRRAKGMLPTDQKLQDDLVTQCREMDTEIQIIKNTLKPADAPDSNEALPVETGFFHEQVSSPRRCARGRACARSSDHAVSFVLQAATVVGEVYVSLA